jgi:dolichyl-diphosphooligosaccharide--protein glycosyltransferase
MPNANPFQQGIGSVTKGWPGSSPFFLAENETEAEKVLTDLDKNRSLYNNTKYVMIDLDMATGKFHAMAAWSNIPTSKYIAAVYQPQGEQLVPVQIWREPYFRTMTSRLFFGDGSEVSEGQGVAIAYRAMELENGAKYPVLTKSPMINKNYSEMTAFVNQSRSEGDLADIVAMNPASSAVPVEALQHYRLVHESETPVTTSGQKFVKTFEHVPGAVIKGNAAAGTNVTIAVPVMTNKERAFIYQQSNVTDSNGEFTLVVPYSTTGPNASGTNFDTKPLGSYRLTVGDRVTDVVVPEEAVMSGTVIKA